MTFRIIDSLLIVILWVVLTDHNFHPSKEPNLYLGWMDVCMAALSLAILFYDYNREVEAK